jgi:hypothetical protein
MTHRFTSCLKNELDRYKLDDNHFIDLQSVLVTTASNNGKNIKAHDILTPAKPTEGKKDVYAYYAITAKDPGAVETGAPESFSTTDIYDMLSDHAFLDWKVKRAKMTKEWAAAMKKSPLSGWMYFGGYATVHDASHDAAFDIVFNLHDFAPQVTQALRFVYRNKELYRLFQQECKTAKNGARPSSMYANQLKQVR